jgi:hypothetical protein
LVGFGAAAAAVESMDAETATAALAAVTRALRRPRLGEPASVLEDMMCFLMIDFEEVVTLYRRHSLAFGRHEINRSEEGE